MTTSPIRESDYYGKGFRQAQHNQAMKGPRIMSFGATRTDFERLNEAKKKNSISDPDPAKPEWQAWNMRPRNKSKEIGPSMRFNSHLQAERMMESLKNKTMTFFLPRDVTGDGVTEGALEKKIKTYVRQGHYDIPNYNQDDDEDRKFVLGKGIITAPISPNSKGSMFKVVPRKSKLNKSNYLVEPNQVMKDLHRKTHFKAATSVARGDICCLNFKKTEFNDQFAEMARNLSQVHDSNQASKDMLSRGTMSIDAMARRGNIWNGKRSFSPLSGEVIIQNGSQSISHHNMKPIGQSSVSVGTYQPLEAESPVKAGKDYALFQDEMNGADVDPQSVTQQVLKLCNVFRQKQEVHGPHNYMRKRTGTGGCGGRKLSPEQFQKLGTYGFKPRVEAIRKSEGVIFTKSPYIPNQHIDIDQAKNQSTNHIRRAPIDTRIEKFDRLKTAQTYGDTATMESSDNVDAPP